MEGGERQHKAMGVEKKGKGRSEGQGEDDGDLKFPSIPY